MKEIEVWPTHGTYGFVSCIFGSNLPGFFQIPFGNFAPNIFTLFRAFYAGCPEGANRV